MLNVNVHQLEWERSQVLEFFHYSLHRPYGTLLIGIQAIEMDIQANFAYSFELVNRLEGQAALEVRSIGSVIEIHKSLQVYAVNLLPLHRVQTFKER